MGQRIKIDYYTTFPCILGGQPKSPAGYMVAPVYVLHILQIRARLGVLVFGYLEGHGAMDDNFIGRRMWRRESEI